MTSSSLSDIAVEKRRQLAATLGLFAMLFVAVGAVSATSAANGLVKAFVVIALVVAVLLGLMAWGVLHSVRMEVADRRLDSAIEAAVRAGGRSMCDCGVEHDPDEMHFVDGVGQHVSGKSGACAHDGAGTDCAHSCDTCVLAAMRLQPAAAFERPAPPRPRALAPAASAVPGRPRPTPGPRRPSPR